jgi:predicted Zn-ribbon and HTH transcriptional regulator
MFIILFKFVIKLVWNGSMNKKVSWESTKNEIATQSSQCPNCGKMPDKLDWYKFRSSNASWRHLAGRAGYLSKCPDCKTIVDEIITMIN